MRGKKYDFKKGESVKILGGPNARVIKRMRKLQNNSIVNYYVLCDSETRSRVLPELNILYLI